MSFGLLVGASAFSHHLGGSMAVALMCAFAVAAAGSRSTGVKELDEEWAARAGERLFHPLYPLQALLKTPTYAFVN